MYTYNKLKNILNKIVSLEKSRKNYFELGEFIDMTIHQIPYFRLKNIVKNIREWELNSLKLADGYFATDMLNLQYNKKIEMLTEKEFDRTFLYPINIICLLIDFLYLAQRKKKRLFRTKVRVSLEKDKRYSICKIYTNIHSTNYWFTKTSEEMWSIARQYTNSINLHSSFLEVKNIDHKKKCLILIKFDMAGYYEEEKKILEIFRKKIGIENIAEFKKNEIRHVIHNTSGKKFIKLVDSRIISKKMNSLYWEFNLIDRLRGLDGFPNVKEYMKIGHYEMFVSDNITGKTFDEYLSDCNGDMETALLFKLFSQVQKLRQNYIVHRDLKSSNIIISPSKKDVYIIDFDQATLNRDLYNKADLKISRFSLSSPCVTLYDTLNRVPKIKEKIEKIQTMLDRVWQEAAKSNSSTPGKEVAYYTYSFGNVDYFGERDFFERWILLEKNNISLKEKVVIDLGCNIGLFGAYSALYGAKYVMCFDMDYEIIRCAKELSEILELNNIKHEVRNLKHKGAFKDINKIDFMFALSVYFWLEDTTEFDRLMKLTTEVLYEGHEQYDAEYRRLREWGFVDIKAIGNTDRLRTVFYARK